MRRNFIGITLFCCAFILTTAGTSAAQNMSNTVVTKEIKFAPRADSASLDGRAKYGMSYVYTIGARKGQKMELELKGKNPELTFSLISPPNDDTVENAFGVTTWTGLLPETGKYKVVVVMNDEKGGAVPFTLTVKVH